MDQDRPVVDRDHLKNQVTKDHQNVIQPQKNDVRIDPEQASPPDELKDADDSKAHADGNGDKSQPIRNRVYGHMYARKMMKPKVERRKADLCSVRANCLHVNAPDQRRPQQECQQEADSRPQVLLFVHTHSVLSVCTSDGINGTEDL